jgi:hypothetical protein
MINYRPKQSGINHETHFLSLIYIKVLNMKKVLLTTKL